jgi:hypothetical protein
MVFHVIGFWLLMLAIPLWGYRFFLTSKLAYREKKIFRRLLDHADERAYFFALKLFGFLVALSAAVLAMVAGLGYIKHGSTQIGSYREVIRSRIYSGVDPVDQALDTFHYDQWLPIAFLTTCALLSISFTLVATALRDISLLNRLRKRLKKVPQAMKTAPKA